MWTRDPRSAGIRGLEDGGADGGGAHTGTSGQAGLLRHPACPPAPWGRKGEMENLRGGVCCWREHKGWGLVRPFEGLQDLAPPSPAPAQGNQAPPAPQAGRGPNVHLHISPALGLWAQGTLS